MYLIYDVKAYFSLPKPSFLSGEDKPGKIVGVTWTGLFQVEFYLAEKHDSHRILAALFPVLLDNKL